MVGEKHLIFYKWKIAANNNVQLQANKHKVIFHHFGIGKEYLVLPFAQKSTENSDFAEHRAKNCFLRVCEEKQYLF